MEIYKTFCEKLFNNWQNFELYDEGIFNFDLSALPEPYLTFGKNSENLYFLTTNPGGVMDFQRRISGFIDSTKNYEYHSKKLAEYYYRNLSGTSKRRINSMYEISAILFYTGFTQVEISPFHSKIFPTKDKFSKFILNYKTIHSDYIQLLKEHLKNKNCISIQAGKPSLNRLNDNWIELLSNVMSVNKSDWKVEYFKYSDKNPKIPTTGAFYVKNNISFKAILFNSGINAPPKLKSMEKFFNELKR